MLSVEIKKQLRQFSLDMTFCQRGGCIGILGSSGCGKSMTLKSIAGIVTPEHGSILVNNRILYDSKQKIDLIPQKRKVGYLFQNYALFPNMTVEQNIGCGLTHNDSQRNQKVRQMIERFKLQGLEKSFPGRLSGGQQQRVALARILTYEPEVLLLDEPFSAMDSYLREGMRLEMIKLIKEYNGTTVLVTHDRDEVYQLSDHILLMQAGKVLEQGETGKVFEHPYTIQAARLTGCKNLAKAKKVSAHSVWVEKWGLTLSTNREVPDDVSYAGIRAHDFTPVSAGEALQMRATPGMNLIPVMTAQVTEMPFEWYITLQNGLWWKTKKSIYEKDASQVIPPYLLVAPGSILLLRSTFPEET